MADSRSPKATEEPKELKNCEDSPKRIADSNQNPPSPEDIGEWSVPSTTYKSPYYAPIPVEIIDDSIPQEMVDDGSWQLDEELGDGLPSEPDDLEDFDLLWQNVIDAEKDEDIKKPAKSLALETKQYMLAPRPPSLTKEQERNGPGLGEQFLFQVAYNGSEKRKKIGLVSAERLSEVLENLWNNFEKFVIGQKGEEIICQTFAFELLPCFLGVLLESKELHFERLEKATKNIMFECMKRASAKEAHFKLKITVAGCFKSEAVTDNLTLELIELWTDILARFEVKRFKVFDDVYSRLRRYRIVHCEDYTHCKRGDKPPRYEVGMIGMVEALAKAQEKQLQSPPPQDPVKAREHMTDLLHEKEKCLSVLLRLLETFMDFVPEREDNEELSTREAKLLSKARAPFLVQIKRIMRLLVFIGLKDDPLEVLQVATGYMHYSLRDMCDEAVARDGHLLSKRRIFRVWTFNSIGYVLCVSLGLLDDENSRNVKEKRENIISKASWGLLDPLYAFHLALPYCIGLCGEVLSTTALRGALLAQLFLDHIPDEAFSEVGTLARVPLETHIKHYPVSYMGLARALAKAASSTEDKKRRQVIYETLQCLLLKFSKGYLQFQVVRNLLLDSTEVAMTAQLVTELKNVLHAFETDSKSEWGSIQALRWDLVRTILPRYLMPRKDILSSLTVIVSICNTILYLSLTDSKSVFVDEEDTQARMKYVSMYARLAKEVLRSLAAVAEHDLKKVAGQAQMDKQSDGESARALCNAAEQTVNDCIIGISTLERSIAHLSGAIR